MVHFIPNILSKEECDFLASQFDIERKYRPSVDYIDPVKKTFENSYGFSPSNYFNVYMDKLKSKVLEYNKEIEALNNVNTFVREYVNNSILEKHIDRKDISVTMSICLHSTINKEWPLCTEIDGKEYCFNTNVGDGILLFDADKTTHWRDTLICNENERVIQFFLHWKPIDFINKKIKTLI